MEEWETGWSCEVLESIVALLFSLAGLADIAARLPSSRRRQVLGILSVGEAEAWAFVFGTVAAPALADGQDTVDDAAYLAARLRALGLLLTTLLAQRVALPGADHPRVDRRTPGGPAGRRASLAAPDTS